MSHVCPKQGCRRTVADEMLACRMHWFAVSPTTRSRVWAAYRGPGPGSPEHTEAVADAIDEMNDDRAPRGGQ